MKPDTETERCAEYRRFNYTPLHMAVSEDNLQAVKILLQAGADPSLRTRIDECETPGEMAEKAGYREIAELLARHGA